MKRTRKVQKAFLILSIISRLRRIKTDGELLEVRIPISWQVLWANNRQRDETTQPGPLFAQGSA